MMSACRLMRASPFSMFLMWRSQSARSLYRSQNAAEYSRVWRKGRRQGGFGSSLRGFRLTAQVVMFPPR